MTYITIASIILWLNINHSCPITLVPPLKTKGFRKEAPTPYVRHPYIRLWKDETQIVEVKVWEIGSYVSVPLPHPGKTTCVIARAKGCGNHLKGGPGQKSLYWATRAPLVTLLVGLEQANRCEFLPSCFSNSIFTKEVLSLWNYLCVSYNVLFKGFRWIANMLASHCATKPW